MNILAILLFRWAYFLAVYRPLKQGKRLLFQKLVLKKSSLRLCFQRCRKQWASLYIELCYFAALHKFRVSGIYVGLYTEYCTVCCLPNRVLCTVPQYLPGQRSLDTVSAKIFRRKKGPGGERRALSADRCVLTVWFGNSQEASTRIILEKDE